ncbi:DUF2141 domain-containing protein [Colwelliaceae bacterium 6441]
MLVKKLVSFSIAHLILSLIGSLSMLILLSLNVHAADLTVKISDIEQGKGHVLVALYHGKDNYKNGEVIKASKVKATHKNELVVFKDLIDGEYAIKMYQDENDNELLDTNMLGIPKEGYGFSNNVGMFGEPDYQEAKFTVKNNTIIEVDLF